MSATYQRRGGPVDVEVARFLGLKPGECAKPDLDNKAADTDRATQMRKHTNPRSDPSGKPTRRK